MPREYKVFHGVGVVVVGVQSDTDLEALAITTQTRPVDYGVPAMRRLQIDLKLTPGREGKNNWSAVRVDDRGIDALGDELPVLKDVSTLDRGITSIGSGTLDQQVKGAFVGGVYIEHGWYNEIYKDKIGYAFPWPGTYCNLGELTTIAYADDAASNGPYAGQRYMGFWATLKSSSSTELAVTFQRTHTLQPVVFSRNGIEFDSNPPVEAFSDASGASGATSLVTASVPETQGLLFVRLEHAARLELVDPKIPIGHATIVAEGAAASATQTGAKQLNISLLDADEALCETQNNIDGESLVSGAFPASKDEYGVVGVVKNVNSPLGPLVVDLIAHARHGILQFGHWVIDSDERASEMLLEEWRGRPLSKLRLLGCNTILTTAGQAAILHLKEVLKNHGLDDVGVYGTTVPLYAYDFGPQGLLKSGLVRESARRPKPVDGPAAPETVNSWFKRFLPLTGSTKADLRRLRTETLEEASRDRTRALEISRWLIDEVASDSTIDEVFDKLEPEFATAPGLLAYPDREQLYPAGSRDGVPVFYRVTSLLDGAFLRFYPEGFKHGVIVRAPRL
jgi:hypothetical protein